MPINSKGYPELHKAPKDDPDRKLTRRETLFVSIYLDTWSYGIAYRDAGYKDCGTFNQMHGKEIAMRPAVAKAITTAIHNAGLDPDSIKTRISQQATINAAEFMVFVDVPIFGKNKQPLIDPQTSKPITIREFAGINWAEVEKRGYLVKGIKYTRQGVPMLEFYDAQRALELSGKTYGMFVDNQDGQAGDSEVSVLPSLPADLLAPSFFGVYRDSRDRKHMEYLLKGGRGSTKSSFASLDFIYLLINHPAVHGIALRQVAETLRTSVYSQLIWAINELGLASKFKCTTSPLEITYRPTEQKIYFHGADEPEKLKSIKPIFGHIGIVWFEELDQFHGPEAVRKIEQSMLRGGEEAWEFKTFNPPLSAANWVNKYVQIPKANQLQHHSTYLDVPQEWLGQTFIDEAEHLKEVNPKAYDHEYLGQVIGTGGQVFENVKIRKITDDEIKQFDHVLPGLDWGFYPDPFAWGKVHYDAARMTLYIFDELRMQKAGNKETYIALVREKRMRPDETIIADSAEPKSVADYRQYSSEEILDLDAQGNPKLDNLSQPIVLHGPSCRGAEKGPESVTYSMKWLQSLAAIVIDPERCPYAAEEFLSYELEQDKDGNFISQYPDRNNHFIDMTRYATNLIWRRRGQ